MSTGFDWRLFKVIDTLLVPVVRIASALTGDPPTVPVPVNVTLVAKTGAAGLETQILINAIATTRLALAPAPSIVLPAILAPIILGIESPQLDAEIRTLLSPTR